MSKRPDSVVNVQAQQSSFVLSGLGVSGSYVHCYCKAPLETINMHDLKKLQSGDYKNEGPVRFKLTGSLDSFPLEILDLGQTLEHLDLSGTGLSSLPLNFAQSLPNLKIAFFSQCSFAIFPRELASCPQLEMVAFRGNGMETIPEDALPPRLRWLILTDNKLKTLPRSIGKCGRLQKCMLAGNQLEFLPEEIRDCKRLGLLRLSSNNFTTLPTWLLEMPELAFLSFAGNPCSSHSLGIERGVSGTAYTNDEDSSSAEIGQPNSRVTYKTGHSRCKLAQVPWSDLEVQHTLGEGASGIISKGLWRIDFDTKQEVAIKIFKGTLTSDGTPEDELAACIAAGQHENIIDVLGRVHEHPDEAKGTFKGGLVMQLIPPHYRTLGEPPSFQTCTRDNYPNDAKLPLDKALNVLGGVAAAAAHLHSREVSHGDLYAHNILTNSEGHALLGDFGAATVHGGRVSPLLEKLEVLAFAHLIEDILGLLPVGDHTEVVSLLRGLHRRCSSPDVAARPVFTEVIAELEHAYLNTRPVIADASDQSWGHSRN